jgi:hypothetical protein
MWHGCGTRVDTFGMWRRVITGIMDFIIWISPLLMPVLLIVGLFAIFAITSGIIYFLLVLFD